MRITYTITIDEKKLDHWMRGLYDGPPDDPVPGEPQPGRCLARGWIAEALDSIAQGYGPDTAWWVHTDDFVTSIAVGFDDSVPRAFAIAQQEAIVALGKKDEPAA